MRKNNPPFLFETIKKWLPLAAGLTVLCGLIYVAVQQNLRLSTNAIPAQVAQAAASKLSSGVEVSDLRDSEDIEISQSLLPFLMVYDEAENQEYSSAVLNGEKPNLPAGVLDYVRIHGSDRITWQPEVGVRAALVILHLENDKGGFVVGGQSLRETENTIDSIGLVILLGWIAVVACTFLIQVVLTWINEKSKD